jgi:hypothetical protein
MDHGGAHRGGKGILPKPWLGLTDDEDAPVMRLANVSSCIDDLKELSGVLQSGMASKEESFLDNEEKMGFLVNSVAHRLLDLPRTPKPATQYDLVSEAVRLGAIIWIIQIKRRFRSHPGTAEHHVSTLLNLLSRESDMEDAWSAVGQDGVRIWLLVLCSISGPSQHDLARSMEMLADYMTARSVSWNEVMAGIHQMPWIDIFEAPCAHLGQKLTAEGFLSGSLDVCHHAPLAR